MQFVNLKTCDGLESYVLIDGGAWAASEPVARRRAGLQ